MASHVLIFDLVQAYKTKEGRLLEENLSFEKVDSGLLSYKIYEKRKVEMLITEAREQTSEEKISV